MQGIVWIKVHRGGWTFRERPEGRAFLGLGIKWIDMQELSDIVIEELFELEASIFEAVSEGLRSLLE